MGNIIEKEVRSKRIAQEFFDLKEEINGLSVGELREKFAVLEDSLDEDAATCNYVEIDAGEDCECISMVYVDFDENWENAELSYENVTVYNENPAECSYQIDMHNHIQQIAEDAMENICDWMLEHGAYSANVCHEDDKVSGIEFTLHASDRQECVFFADFRDQDVDSIVEDDEFDEWFEDEIQSIYEGYNVDEEVLLYAEQCRKVGVRVVLESCEDIDAQLEALTH